MISTASTEDTSHGKCLPHLWSKKRTHHVIQWQETPLHRCHPPLQHQIKTEQVIRLPVTLGCWKPLRRWTNMSLTTTTTTFGSSWVSVQPPRRWAWRLTFRACSPQPRTPNLFFPRTMAHDWVPTTFRNSLNLRTNLATPISREVISPGFQTRRLGDASYDRNGQEGCRR